MTELTDEAIAKRVQEGDVESFGVLMERYEPKLMRYARKFLIEAQDAEDQVQNVFLKAYTNIHSFDVTRQFSSWLYRVAHNQFINYIAKRQRQPISFFSPDTVFPHLFAKETADSGVREEEIRNSLDTCLDKLDAKYREILILYFYEELSYAEIADVLHIPTSTVGVRLNRAKAAIKKIYNK